ncbi:MAG: nucleotidyltransferase domain-containing protein [Bacteroides sp.]|nr:nucleotidyltransferase domain-containing protein [Bacteroides sp.]MCM1457427.1 nucleotidyltransferase domain-containing protein [Lachnoclostridium sp.]
MTQTAIIERIKEVMQKAIPPCMTILYGSQARGDARSDSDIDLLVLVDGESLSIEDELRITAPLFSIEYETGVAISPYVMLRKDWDNRPFNTPFSNNISKEGLILS